MSKDFELKQLSLPLQPTGPVFYQHAREHDIDFTTQGIVRTVSNKGGSTMAYTSLGKQDGLDVVAIGVSICSDLDNFSRKIGRELAEQRMINNPIIVLSADVTRFNENPPIGKSNTDVAKLVYKQVFGRDVPEDAL